MAEEFRFVVKDIAKLNPLLDKNVDFIDYFIKRDIRVRKFIKDYKGREGKFFFTVSEPNSIYKKSEEISKTIAETLIEHAILVVAKKGVGHIIAEGIEGYSENVSAFKPGKNKPFIDEVHIEFEVDNKLITKLISSLS